MKVRLNPYVLGMLIAFVGFPIAVAILVYNPGWEVFLASHSDWLNLAFYTAAVFGMLTWWYWNRRASVRFWGLLIVFLMLHVVGFAFYISHVGPLFIIHYTVIGPFEAAFIGFLLDRAMILLRRIGRPARV